jgi:ADP-ribosylglycohydrolase
MAPQDTDTVAAAAGAVAPAAGPAIGSPEWIAAHSFSSRTACRKAQLDLARIEGQDLVEG